MSEHLRNYDSKVSLLIKDSSVEWFWMCVWVDRDLSSNITSVVISYSNISSLTNYILLKQLMAQWYLTGRTYSEYYHHVVVVRFLCTIYIPNLIRLQSVLIFVALTIARRTCRIHTTLSLCRHAHTVTTATCRHGGVTWPGARSIWNTALDLNAVRPSRPHWPHPVHYDTCLQDCNDWILIKWTRC